MRYGCKTEILNPALWHTMSGIEGGLPRCPRTYLTPNVMHTVRLISWIDPSHTWPDAGGILDQANQFFEAANIVVVARQKAWEEKCRNQRSKS